jgi:hypothetical protein
LYRASHATCYPGQVRSDTITARTRYDMSSVVLRSVSSSHRLRQSLTLELDSEPVRQYACTRHLLTIVLTDSIHSDPPSRSYRIYHFGLSDTLAVRCARACGFTIFSSRRMLIVVGYLASCLHANSSERSGPARNDPHFSYFGSSKLTPFPTLRSVSASRLQFHEF